MEPLGKCLKPQTQFIVATPAAADKKGLGLAGLGFRRHESSANQEILQAVVRCPSKGVGLFRTVGWGPGTTSV